MISDNDAARKYLPKSNDAPRQSVAGQDHGTFTNVAYAVAWIIAIFGTLAGVLIIGSAMDSYEGAAMIPAAIGLIIGSWVSSCGIGTLAEISRKLTPRV